MSWSVMWFLLFFLVGFVALASLYAAAGSMASRSEDVQNTTSPLMYLIMIIYFWVVFSMSNPCLLYTSPSPRDAHESRMPSSA